jgi:hypothetical protein
MKVETKLFMSITLSEIGQAVILVIMYVKIFKTDVIVFIGKITAECHRH